MATEDEPLNYIERKVKAIVIHPKYQDEISQFIIQRLKTFNSLADLTTEILSPYGSKNDSDFKSEFYEILTRPLREEEEMGYDIGLLKLNKPVSFQANVMPICLPKDDDNFEGRIALVTGWGNLGTV